MTSTTQPDSDQVRIPQTQPDLGVLEHNYVQEVLGSGQVGAGGSFTKRAVSELKDALGCADVILTPSGTDALELAAMLLDIGPGDVVILPSFTFASVATAFARTGAKIRFADIEATTLGVDANSVASLMDASVRAIVPVHYGGMACDLGGLLNVLASFERAELVEDNAHGLFGTYCDKPLGSFGPLAATSFHATKTLTTGEGGALIINDPAFADRAHVIAEKGTDRQAFLRGAVDKYTWRDTGSSFVMAEALAAILLAQLERRTEIFGTRQKLFEAYTRALSAEAKTGRMQMPGLRAECAPIWHLFYVLLPNEAARDAVALDMQAGGIMATFHYVPLHSAPAAARFVDRQTHCPVTDDVSRRLLRLPFHTAIGETEVARVVETFLRALDRRV